MAEQRAQPDARRLADALTAGPEAARALGRRLAALGLNPRAVCACFAVRCPAHATRRAAGAAVPDPVPPAALLPWLLAAGRPVAADATRRRLGDDLARLVDLDLVELRGERVHPRLLLIPAGDALVVCRPGAPGDGTLPDDSSYHLLGALPRRRAAAWLDVGTGNGFLPLAAPATAAVRRASDVERDALDLARAGAALSGVEVDLIAADLLGGAGERRWPLITFNAPMAGAAALLARFWAEVPAALDGGGEALVHSVLVPEALPGHGRAVVARYTPPGVEPAFAVTRWQAAGQREVEIVDVELSGERPHVDRVAVAQ